MLYPATSFVHEGRAISMGTGDLTDIGCQHRP